MGKRKRKTGHITVSESYGSDSSASMEPVFVGIDVYRYIFQYSICLLLLIWERRKGIFNPDVSHYTVLVDTYSIW